MKPTPIEEQLHIEKLVFGGQGLAKLSNGQVVFVWNALPGETVQATLIKKKNTYLEAIATEIITPSPQRIEPTSSHYLSTAPWEIMTPEEEDKQKQAIAKEIYGKIGGMIFSEQPIDITKKGKDYGYRNKIEFSFAENPETNTVSLAFFGRGSHIRVPVKNSELAEPVINEVASYLLSWIQENSIPIRSLKSLIIRSNGEGHAIAGLFLKDRLTFAKIPELTDALKGFHIYYSTHKSPASVVTDTLYSLGDDYLIANLKSTELQFGIHSFFQINIPVFDECLTDIAMFLDPKKPLLDFYSGVGAIGLPLSHNRTETILVDSNKEAIDYAQANIERNARTNTTAFCSPAEDIKEKITQDKQLILDPPRAGLHASVVNRILAVKPEKIIYLSCNLSTQARDIRMIEEVYRVTHIKLYNFFPRTPHIEGLVVLERYN